MAYREIGGLWIDVDGDSVPDWVALLPVFLGTTVVGTLIMVLGCCLFGRGL